MRAEALASAEHAAAQLAASKALASAAEAGLAAKTTQVQPTVSTTVLALTPVGFVLQYLGYTSMAAKVSL